MTATTKSLNLPVQGMTCASCVSHVEGALKELPGVSNVVVNLATNKASLSYDPARVTLTDMARAVDDVGYVVPTAGIQGLSIRQEAFMDIGTLVLIGIGIVVVLVVVIVLDLLLAGGAISSAQARTVFERMLATGRGARAIVEEATSGKTHFLEIGQSVAGFKVLDISESRVVLSDPQTGEEVVVSVVSPASP